MQIQNNGDDQSRQEQAPQNQPESGIPKTHVEPLFEANLLAEIRAINIGPYDYLPEPATDMIRVTCWLFGCPPIIPALIVLGVLSACLRNKVWATGSDGGLCPVSLFVFIFLGSGVGKSSMSNPITSPLVRFSCSLEKEWEDKTCPEAKERITQLKNMKEGIYKANKGNLELTSEDNQRTMSLAAQIKQCEDLLKKNPGFFIENATPEAIEKRVIDTDGFAQIITPDGRQFSNILFGCYSQDKSSNHSTFTHGYSGESFSTDRISRDRTHIEQAVIGILVLVQDDVKFKLFDDAPSIDSGFLPRFLLGGATDFPPRPKRGRRFPQEILDAWKMAVTEQCKFRWDKDTPLVSLVATPAAQEIFETFINKNLGATDSRVISELRPEEMPDQPGELADVRSFIKRAGENAIRIAAVLTAWRNPKSRVIEEEAARQGLEIMQACMAEQLAILEPYRGKVRKDAETRIAEAVDEWEKENDAPPTVRDIHRQTGLSYSAIQQYYHVRGKPGRKPKEAK